MRSKELDQASVGWQTTKRELDAKAQESENLARELENRTRELESKSFEAQTRTIEVKQKAKEIEKLKEICEKKTKDADAKIQELLSKDTNAKYMEQQITNRERDMLLLRAELEEVTKVLEERTRALEEQTRLTLKITMEVEKWQTLYQRATEELNSKNRRQSETMDSPDMSPKSSTSSFGSWLSPNQLKISNPLSYLWTTKTGPLVKNTAKYQFLERRGSSRNSSVWKATFKSSEKAQQKVVALKKIDQSDSLEAF